MTVHLGGFVVAVLLAYVIPGPDWFVVLRRSTQSRSSGVAAALGVQTGLVVHMSAAALGVSAILLTSSEAFTVIKLVGAAYLIWLGIGALRDAVGGARSRSGTDTDTDIDTVAPLRVWAQAFGANVLNPKAALFFVAVLPQFLSADTAIAPQILLLGAVDIGIGVAWWLLFVATASRFQHYLHRRRARAAVDGVTGAALVGLGGALALAGRAPA